MAHITVIWMHLTTHGLVFIQGNLIRKERFTINLKRVKNNIQGKANMTKALSMQNYILH
jgi:hypothetical protein